MMHHVLLEVDALTDQPSVAAIATAQPLVDGVVLTCGPDLDEQQAAAGAANLPVHAIRCDTPATTRCVHAGPVLTDADPALPRHLQLWAVNTNQGSASLVTFRRVMADLHDHGPAQVCIDISRAVDVGGPDLAMKFISRMDGHVAAVRLSGDPAGHGQIHMSDLDALARAVDALPAAVPVIVAVPAHADDLPRIVAAVRRHLPAAATGDGR